MVIKIGILSIGIVFVLSNCSVNNNSVVDKNDKESMSEEDTVDLIVETKDSISIDKISVGDTVNYDVLNSKFKKNVLTRLKRGETYSKEFDQKELIESFKYLGALQIENQAYRVYYFYKDIKVAVGYRGQSRIVFLGLKNIISYPIDTDEAPTNVEAGKLYFGKEHIYIKSLGEMLVIPHDGLVREDKLESRIISNLKMY